MKRGGGGSVIGQGPRGREGLLGGCMVTKAHFTERQALTPGTEVPEMLGFASGSTHSVLDQTFGHARESNGKDSLLPMQDSGNLHSQHLRLAETGTERQSCELLPPQSLAEDMLSKATSYDTVYDIRIQDLDAHFSFEGSSFFDLPMLGLSPLPIDDPDFPLSPHIIKRRRGGIVEQRDIIKAHQAHKMQSTPQAKRKEWE
ncbi:hypothetical protein chiPu_0020733 [Chiloscyllium punctatum]|uniref:Uncharacterized protein n=1 Tax=Chiloscyllium punctatum TaxID=137246 RepID=A0A401RJ25_CHIPU|nr:hypothetical protein [Chiloscyllium punctatum]